MASISIVESNPYRNRKNRNRLARVPKTDMTPMVDLGFLLIAFFVVTTELSKPLTTDLVMPKDGPPMPVGDSDVLTVLPGNDNVFHYYHGNWNEAVKMDAVLQTNLSRAAGLGSIISEKQQFLDHHNKKEGRKGLMVLIKPGKSADYGLVVDILDEILIHDVKKYAILKPQPEEIQYLANHP